ncbi:MAG: sulfite exporter TauE/SafE family protein [Planctomycetia bacterium]|nr:sulfite exporter TauE/SafE family protein [Planctomycetia bacterium]
MDSPKTILFVVLGAVAAWFVVAWIRLAKKHRSESLTAEQQQTSSHAVLAFVCAFFDTLGIGCFAPTAAAFKFRGSIPDEKIPGTLNVGYAIPTIAQAFIYIESVEVDFTTLALMIGAAVLGSWLGAGFVAHWSRRKVQIGMGVALLAAATLMLMKQFNFFPTGGEALALSGVWLGAGLAANFALGALMTLGIGLYGPCLIVVSLLGMSPRAAFPIMAGSCAFLMPIGGLRFVREGSCSSRTAIVMTLAGIPAVLIAAFLVKQLPLEYVRWLVVIVVTYAATMMLKSALTATTD